jgi:hypothetical protein
VPLLEVDESPAEFERVVDATKLVNAPSTSVAGAHADLTISSVFKIESLETLFDETDVPSNMIVHLPPGIVANFGAVPACRLSAFESTVYDNETAHCSAASQLGVVSGLYGGQLPDRSYPLYKINIQNLFGAHGEHLAAIGFPYEFITKRVPVILRADLRTDSDYGMTLSGRSHFEEFVPAPFFTFWGDPGASIHDFERWDPETQEWGASVEAPSSPLIANSSDCSSEVLEADLKLRYWFEPEHWLPDDPEDFAYRSFLPEPAGCEGIHFNPQVAVSTSTQDPASSTGLNIRLEMPRSAVAAEPETPPLKDLTLALPEGLTVNSATADGMAGCTPSQIGLLGSNFPGPNPIHFELGEAHCPDASKIGVGTADTPLVEEPVKATIYFASPYENPFHSLMALYVVLESPEFTIKLAAKVDSDPNTGRLTATMTSLPQLPLERIDLKIFDGPRATLATPRACGEGAAISTLLPWSAPQWGPPSVVESGLGFGMTGGKAACPGSLQSLPFSPLLTAGARNPVAGAPSPFIFRVDRRAGDQELKAIEAKLPRGLVADLEGVAYCSDAEIVQAEERRDPGAGVLEATHPSCPADSKIGSVVVASGTGSSPLFTRGTVYLAGPYKGAPLSMVAIVPATAGGDAARPLFDLGAVVVRTALTVEPRSAQITASSDPIPQMMSGIPLRIDQVTFLLDRPGFIRDPSTCEEMKLAAGVDGWGGAVAKLTNRFQLGGCRRLAFGPTLRTRLVGGSRRGQHPGLQAVFASRGGDAPVSRASIKFPPSLTLDTTRIDSACPRGDFVQGSCPPRSILGYATAWSPLLEEPLRGPVYLTSAKNQLELALALRGQVPLNALGTIQTGRHAFEVTLKGLPDVPLSKLKFLLRGGSRGILTNKRGLCAGPQFVIGRFTAHSGRAVSRHSILGSSCAGRKRLARHSTER